MKSHFWMAQGAVLGALALQACGTTGETSSPPAPEQRDAVITVAGTNTEDVSAVPIVVGGVDVTADGQAVVATAEPGAIDLADTEGRVAAHFSFPANAEQVTVNLRLDDFGGYETTSGQTGVLDARGTNLTFEVPASELVKSGQVTIAVNLSESLVAAGSGMRLVPHLSITY